MSVRPFEIEIHEHVATLWLAHPERRNAMGPEFWAELPGVVARRAPPAPGRAGVIAARGPPITRRLPLLRMAAALDLVGHVVGQPAVGRGARSG